MKDMHNNTKFLRGESPAAITAGDATLVTEIIDTQGMESTEFIWFSGAITDGAFACSIYESDDSGMSGETEVTDAAHLLGANPAFTAAGHDNSVQKQGYRGNKRYVRSKAVQSGATTGGYLACLVAQSPKLRPVA